MRRYLFVLILLLITLAGGALRFYNLAWGNGYFFHPDERNIAGAVTQLKFPDKLNPHFFAYGAFPIYLVYAIGVLQNFFFNHLTLQPSTLRVEFAQAILIGRGWSALLSTLMIPLVYFLIKRLVQSQKGAKGAGGKGQKELGLVAAGLTAFLPGLIQFAHFATFETFLTFEYLLIFWFALSLFREARLRDYIFLGVLLGLSLATKVVSVFMLLLLFAAHFFRSLAFNQDPLEKLRAVFFSRKLLLGTASALVVGFVAAPFNFLDRQGFLSAMRYEGGVARGTLSVFYTGHFVGARAVAYQILRVFPFILGWPLMILGASGAAWVIWRVSGRLGKSGQKQNSLEQILLLLVPGFYLSFHLPLFVKWTRYMVPVLPFVVILITLFLFEVGQFLQELFTRTKNWGRQKAENGRQIFEERGQKTDLAPYTGHTSSIFRYLFSSLRLSSSFFCFRFLQYFLTPSIAFLLLSHTFYQGLSLFSIYTRPDTRVQAAQWAGQNLPKDAKILSEVYDLGILPFNNQFPIENIKLFNAYELDGSHGRIESEKQSHLRHQQKLQKLLAWADYIVVPSQRIYDSRLTRPDLFPAGASYYQKLFSGRLGFTKIAEFDNPPCLTKTCLLLPNESKAEQTFKVFDHPQIVIFKKAKGVDF